MHETLSPEFIGHVDRVDSHLDRTTVRGWLVGRADGAAGAELVAAGLTFGITRDRPDVAAWYKTSDPRFLRCGFEFTLPYPGPTLRLSARAGGRDFPIFEVKVPAPPSGPLAGMTPMRAPQVLVVDDFYENPDAVRDFALRQKFRENQKYFRGKRTERAFLFPGMMERFEALLNSRIVHWDDMPVNGVFQYCTAQDALVYHSDNQTYAAAIYLTPDAPPSAGTTLYRSRAHPDVRRFPHPGYRHNQIFPTGHFDRTPLELVDVIGNVYNRLVIWDAKLLHSASEYFGDRLENARLFHLFFFDI